LPVVTLGDEGSAVPPVPQKMGRLAEEAVPPSILPKELEGCYRPVVWAGDPKVLNNVENEIYVAPGCCEGCHGCCANSLFFSLTYGSHMCCARPSFTITIKDDGKSGVGKDAKLCGCAPQSVIPCFNGCGFGPLAFITPFDIVTGEDGQMKWVGNGQICAGGCCPCMHNKGDYGMLIATEDGSSPDKPHVFVPMSPFWPPCLTGKPLFLMMQKGVGPPSEEARVKVMSMAR